MGVDLLIAFQQRLLAFAYRALTTRDNPT